MESFVKCAAVATLLFAANVLHAQLQLSSADLAAIESSTPLSWDEMPPIGTFYSVADPNLPPAPGNFFDLSGWSIGDGYYLLDDVDGNGSGGGLHAMDDSGPAFPGGGYGGGMNPSAPLSMKQLTVSTRFTARPILHLPRWLCPTGISKRKCFRATRPTPYHLPFQ